LFHHGQQASARHNSLVTTFSSIIFKSNAAHLFHVGDSRIYRYRSNQQLELLTRDHVQQSGNRTLLTRALGMDSHLEIDYQQKSTEQGDAFILTSDGVHEFVSPAEIRQAIEAGGDLETTAQTIVEHALSSGSDDNLTCLIARLDELPIATIDEVYRQLTALAIPPVMEVGMKIDGYEIKRVVHSGTRSHIYVVQHPDHQRPYILKAPSEHFSEDAQYLEGFIREQWIGLRVNHDAIMKVYAPNNDSQFLYLLAEYIEGKTLRQWMHDNDEPVSLEKMREIVQGIITGLRVFKRLEMIHRDLKPENIMICTDGSIKLIDFGTVKVNGLNEIASVIAEEIPVGSVDYIAPEYLLDGQADHRSDIFSLGVIIYEMLSGKLPYNVSHAHRRMPKNRQEWHYQSLAKYNENIPVWIDCALQKATHPNIKRRYDVLSEFSADLYEPNASLLQKHQQAPLLERNPIFVWQGLSALLFLVIIVQWLLLF